MYTLLDLSFTFGFISVYMWFLSLQYMWTVSCSNVINNQHQRVQHDVAQPTILPLATPKSFTLTPLYGQQTQLIHPAGIK